MGADSREPDGRQLAWKQDGLPVPDLSRFPVDHRDGLQDLEEVPEGFYAALPVGLEREQIREYLPWWVVVRAMEWNDGGRGNNSLHFPAEGSSRDDVDKLCDAAHALDLDDKDIATHPPGFTEKCTRCVERLRELAAE